MRFLLALSLLTRVVAAPVQPYSCSEWHECQRMALEAAGRKEYETFHDLAWRAVQTGTKQDPRLMLLLARAQSLSGRPHDALVTLRRLAEMGVAAAEAETSDDFRRVRSLSAWPEVAAALQAVLGTGRAVTMEKAPSDAPAVEPARPEMKPGSGDEGTRLFAPPGLSPIGLAYDAVSQRFVIADEQTDTLKVLDERSRRVVDLLGSGWAGLYRTTAIEIDAREGTLWVVGAHMAEPGGEHRTAVHKLQLVSGRLLYTVTLPPESGAARFTDVAATAGGAIVALDSLGGRIFRLGARGKSFEHAAKLDVTGATSVAPAGAAVVYVAHPAGLVRVDLAAGRSSNVQAGRDVNLKGLQRIRWHGGALFGIQKKADGNLAAVRIRLDPRGRRALSIHVLDAAASQAAAITGGAFYYVRPEPGNAGTSVRALQLR